MDNKSYAKCRLCEYKGGCAFNHNGDQELCDLNVTHIDLADHDKRIRDAVISEILKNVEFEEKWLSDAWKENGYNYSSRDIDIAFSGIKNSLRKMKGEQND